jgi:peptidoglycan hydrolase-like protein with peptidoglycan-binding domain
MHPDGLAALAAFGRTTTINVDAYCAPVSSISAVQQ